MSSLHRTHHEGYRVGCRHGLLGCQHLPRPSLADGCEGRWWRGRWVKATAASRPPIRGRCWWWESRYDCSDAANRHVVGWEWLADDAACRMDTAHATAAVQAACAQNRSILLVGDSLTYQLFHAMLRRTFDGLEDRVDEKTCSRRARCVPLPCGGATGSSGAASLCMRQTFFFSATPLALSNRTGVVQATCCDHEAEKSGTPHAADIPGWTAALGPAPAGSDATASGEAVAPIGWVVINPSVAHMAGTSCVATHGLPEMEGQVLQHFERTTAELAATLARAAVAGTALWWLSLPGGAAGCTDAPSKPLDPDELDAACSPASKFWGSGTRAEAFCWARIARLDQIGSAMFARSGNSVLSVSRPALLRPDARVGGAEAPVERAHAARANESVPLFAEVTGVPSARYLDCLHFCLQGVPAFYALAVFRFVVLGRSDHTHAASQREARHDAKDVPTERHEPASTAVGTCGLR